jgi:F-type H+-transporting ATPase subunit b
MVGMLLEGSLAIRWWEILLHVVNLIILILFLKMLVYKPVMKAIRERQEKLSQMEQDNKQFAKEAEEMNAKKEEIFDETRKKAEYITLDATKQAEQRSKEIANEAKAKADAMINRAQKDIENQKAKMQQEVKEEVSDLAVDIAGKILEREVSKQDNQKIIDESLKSWQ